MPAQGQKIIEGEVCPDHLHLLLSIPPKMRVSGFMGYQKADRESDQCIYVPRDPFTGSK